MLENIIRYSQPILIFLMGLSLFFWSRLATVFPLHQRQIIGITVSLLAGVIFYFDRNINAILLRPKNGEHINLTVA